MSMLVNEFNETDLVGKNAYPLYSKIGATVEAVNPATKSGIIKWRSGELVLGAMEFVAGRFLLEISRSLFILSGNCGLGLVTGFDYGDYIWWCASAVRC